MSQISPVLMPICELCDRLTIARLKLERLPEQEIDKTGLQKQVDYYQAGVDPALPRLSCLIEDLYLINGQIWDTEAAIRQGRDGSLGLEEIGRRALKIRNLNRMRVAIKNSIADLTAQPEFRDCKMNHVSEVADS